MVIIQRVGVRYIIPDPLTSPSLINLNGVCGRKAPMFPNVRMRWLGEYSGIIIIITIIIIIINTFLER